MKDLLRDDLKYKEIPSKPKEKDPYHHHILDFAYFYRYGHQYLTYLRWKLLSKILFGKTMPQKYPTYLQFGHMSKLSYFFWDPSLSYSLWRYMSGSDMLGWSGVNSLWQRNWGTPSPRVFDTFSYILYLWTLFSLLSPKKFRFSFKHDRFFG